MANSVKGAILLLYYGSDNRQCTYESLILTKRLDSDAPKAARQARVEPVEKVILCYNDAIKTL
jgi:hypothetical protein